MNISGNELNVTVTKACVGCGVVRGVAEDLGRACLELALAGKPPLTSILKALDGYDPDASCTPAWIETADGWKVPSLTVLPYGPSAIDFAHLAGLGGCARIAQVDFPDLIHGLALADDRAFDIDEAANRSISVRLSSKQSVLDGISPIGGCEVDDNEWQRLYSHAEKILVPADDTNRADAGAGLTDND